MAPHGGMQGGQPPGRRDWHGAEICIRAVAPYKLQMVENKNIVSNDLTKGTILLHKDRSLFLLGNSCIEQDFCPLCGGFWRGMMQIQQAEQTNPPQSNPHH